MRAAALLAPPGGSGRYLLVQPHSFEGLGRIVVDLHPRQLAVAEREDLRESHVHRQAGRLGAASLADDSEDAVAARVVDRYDLYFPVVEGSAPFSDEPPRLVEALVCLLLRPPAE